MGQQDHLIGHRSLEDEKQREGQSIYAQIAETATSFGLSIDQRLDILRDAANATSGFCDRVTVLENVPKERRESLVSIVRKEREMLAKDSGKSYPKQGQTGIPN